MTKNGKITAPITSYSTRAAVRELGPWTQNLRLPDGTETAPEHAAGDAARSRWTEIAGHLPHDLSGWTALDVDCNAGFYTFELARRGARVLGVDSSEHHLAQAKWARAELGLSDRVRFEALDAYDLVDLHERFDIVLFIGVFARLRYPLLGLDLAVEKTKRLLVFQTTIMPGEDLCAVREDAEELAGLLERGWPKMALAGDRVTGGETTWWIPNHACVMAMLRSAELRVIARPGNETYVCQPFGRRPAQMEEDRRRR